MQQNQFALSSSHFCGSPQFPQTLHHFPPDGDGDGAELQNVNSFTRSKILELNFTPRKARK